MRRKQTALISTLPVLWAENPVMAGKGKSGQPGAYSLLPLRTIILAVRDSTKRTARLRPPYQEVSKMPKGLRKTRDRGLVPTGLLALIPFVR